MFMNSKMNQVAVQVEGRHLVADLFCGLRRSFMDDGADLLQKFLDIR